MKEFFFEELFKFKKIKKKLFFIINLIKLFYKTYKSYKLI